MIHVQRAWAILVINLQHVEIHKAILCQDTKNILIHITWTLHEEVGIWDSTHGTACSDITCSLMLTPVDQHIPLD